MYSGIFLWVRLYRDMDNLRCSCVSDSGRWVLGARVTSPQHPAPDAGSPLAWPPLVPLGPALEPPNWCLSLGRSPSARTTLPPPGMSHDHSLLLYCFYPSNSLVRPIILLRILLSDLHGARAAKRHLRTVVWEGRLYDFVCYND